MKRAGLFSCLFLWPLVSSAQWQLEGPSLKAYQHVLRFEFDDASALISNDLPVSQYLEHLTDAVQLFLTEDDSMYSAYRNAFDIRESFIEDQEPSPYRDYYLAQMLLHDSFIRLKFGEELNGAWAFRQSYRAIEKNIERYPDFPPNQKIRGLHEVIVGSAPERHQWLLKLLGFDGSITSGLQQLQVYGGEPGPEQLETHLMLAFIHSHMLQEYAISLEYLDPYQDQLTNHALINFTAVSIHAKHSHAEKGLTLLAEFTPSPTAYPFPFTQYLQGKLLLQKGEWAKAVAALQEFQEHFRGVNYLKDAAYKTGIGYYMLGDAQSELWFDRSRSIKTSVTEADKYAGHALQSPLPHKDLIQARLLTDGGYYEHATQALEGIDKSALSGRDVIEYSYRFGRLYHRTGQLSMAIPLYKATIEETYTDQWYFAPNAALQLGYIHLSTGELDQAESSFRKALTYDNHPYQNSIDNKAKAGLSTVKMRRGA